MRTYFILSTARSGSKWLTNYLNHATSLTARHEFMLNHRFEGGVLTPDKRTADGLMDLIADPIAARDLLTQARDYLATQQGNQAEVNVYLERFAPLLLDVFPDATIIHLHRDPRDVVRSIIGRDWYDTPKDTRHPTMDVEGWANLSQFEKACWYARRTNQTLTQITPHRLSFERMVSDPTYLDNRLHELGIEVRPNSAAAEHGKRVNESRRHTLPAPDEWSAPLTDTYSRICSTVAADLGYEPVRQLAPRLSPQPLGYRASRENPATDALLDLVMRQPGDAADRQVLTQLHWPETDAATPAVTVHGADAAATPDGLNITPSGDRHAHVMLGASAWNRLNGASGWPAAFGAYCRVELDAEVVGEGSATLMAVMYDDAGAMLRRRRLRRLPPGQRRHVSSFRPPPEAARFDLALYLSQTDLPNAVVLHGLRIDQRPLAPRSPNR